MADVKWIKIVTDIFDDEKMLLIESMPDADAIIVIWFKLLCLAGKSNNNGVFMLNNKIAYNDDMLATIFRRKPTVVKLALSTFEQFDMIEITDNVIRIPNWDKHQNIAGLDKIREQSRLRVQRFREKNKVNQLENNAEECNGNVALQETLPSHRLNDSYSYSSSSSSNLNLKDKNKEHIGQCPTDVQKDMKRFSKPTIEEIQAHNTEIDAEAFWNFYESKGWYVGKNKMVSWKSSVANWMRNQNTRKPKYQTRDERVQEQASKIVYKGKGIEV